MTAFMGICDRGDERDQTGIGRKRLSYSFRSNRTFWIEQKKNAPSDKRRKPALYSKVQGQETCDKR